MRKPIFKLSKGNSGGSQSDSNNNNDESKERIFHYERLEEVNWESEGFSHAGMVRGGLTPLLVYARRILENHKLLAARNVKRQEEEKAPFRVKLQKLVTQNDTLKNKLKKINDEKVPKVQGQIDEHKEEIASIKKNPKEHTGGNVSKAGFYIGIFILFFLTIYLFVFYSSASYSAFFKEFSLNNIGVADSIFDPKAIPNALEAGIMELVLILTIPFVFLGLGYLIHKFQENKSVINYLKVFALVVVTFIFDAILAYEITEKIYNIKAENSFNEMEPYSISFAFEQVNFWLIIFAGFIVYIIWGLVFDFTMMGYNKMHSIQMHIEPIQDKIKKLEEQLEIFEKTEHKIEKEIGENDVQISALQDKIDNYIIYDWKGLHSSISQFLSGWLRYCDGANMGDGHITECRVEVESFIIDNIEKKQGNEKL